MSYDRRERIRLLLEKQEIVTIKELEKEFPDVSSMTIRRDLESLESMGQAIRIRGGARAVRHFPGSAEAVYAMRAVENPEGKAKIARLAVEYIETGRSVYFDAGTTVMALAKITPDLNLSILTSAPNVALELVQRYNPTVNLIGGVLSRTNLALSGVQSFEMVKNFNIDIAFVVPSAFSIESGFSCGNQGECELKRAIIRKARRRILLIDSGKFDKNLPFTFAKLSEVDLVLTDREPDGKFLEEFEKRGVALRFPK